MIAVYRVPDDPDPEVLAAGLLPGDRVLIEAGRPPFILRQAPASVSGLLPRLDPLGVHLRRHPQPQEAPQPRSRWLGVVR